MYKHKIAIDVGDVRIGVAVSDLLGITANPRETYWRKKGDIEADIRYFCEYAKNEDADTFVLGLPKNMDGSLGFRPAVFSLPPSPGSAGAAAGNISGPSAAVFPGSIPASYRPDSRPGKGSYPVAARTRTRKTFPRSSWEANGYRQRPS